MIFFVFSDTALSFPHMTPARAIGPLSSAIIISFVVSVYSLSLSARSFSPERAIRTVIPHVILSASKTCIGWPKSTDIQFVISTRSIFGESSALSIMRLIPRGLFPTVMFSIFSAWYARHFSVSIERGNFSILEVSRLGI